MTWPLNEKLTDIDKTILKPILYQINQVDFIGINR